MEPKTREQVYDEQIRPLMTQIIEIAKAHEIPIFATFQLTSAADSAKDGPLFCSTAICYPWADTALWARYRKVAMGKTPDAILLMTVGRDRGPRKER